MLLTVYKGNCFLVGVVGGGGGGVSALQHKRVLPAQSLKTEN